MDIITPVLRDSNLYRYKGFCFFKEFMKPEFIESLQDFEIRDDDVFMITYPKSENPFKDFYVELYSTSPKRTDNAPEWLNNVPLPILTEEDREFLNAQMKPEEVNKTIKNVSLGTIWTQQILSLIYSEGYRNGMEQQETSERVPWIEFPFVSKNPNYDHINRPSPRLFASHLSYGFVPQGLKNRKAKIIYVMRNPKDVMKSLYHFEAMAIYAETSPDFDHFFQKFLDGDVFAGSWFDHVRGWYTHKDYFNILFIKYEDMIMDLRSVVQKVCIFLGKELDNESLDVVVKRATFNEMKKDPLANKENMPEDFFDFKAGKFMRKGTVGDWKNAMTEAQSETFDRIFQEKMGDLDLHFTWDINKKKSE